MSIKETIATIKQRDPAARSTPEIVLAYPGFHIVLLHRLAHRLHRRGWRTPARVVSHLGRLLTGIEIHPGATIGERFFIDHGMGVVIGETSIVGDDVLLYQNVTLGGTGNTPGKRHPTIGDRVTIGAGAKILGDITVGDDAIVGAGAVVLSNVAPGATAVGVPARSVRSRSTVEPDRRVEHQPDPYRDQILYLMLRVEELEAEVRRLRSPGELESCPCPPN